MAKLKKYNGRGYEGNTKLYVGAKNRTDASRMLAELFGRSVSQWKKELKVYFSECWGNPMEGIELSRGVWQSQAYVPKEVPVQIFNGEE